MTTTRAPGLYGQHIVHKSTRGEAVVVVEEEEGGVGRLVEVA
jgi:hypothetical protein